MRSAIYALICPLLVVAASEARATQKDTVLYNFKSKNAYPEFALVPDGNGDYYGVTGNGGDVTGKCGTEGCGTVFLLTPASGTKKKWAITTLYAFKGGSKDGAFPASKVTVGPDGTLYGVTEQGGPEACGYDGGCGVAYKLSPPVAGTSRWTETVMHIFKGGRDGSLPYYGLTLDSAGNLFGATQIGGTGNCSATAGCGVIFELTSTGSGKPDWSETILYTFLGTAADGWEPNGDLYLDANGNLFGSTALGATGGCINHWGCGAVFELSPPSGGGKQWSYSELYQFSGSGGDAAQPVGGLVAGPNGILYGAAYRGGLAGCAQSVGCGAVYQMTPPTGGATAWTEAMLYAFKGGTTDGEYPADAVILDGAGNLYGATQGGGAAVTCNNVNFAGCGTAFKLSPPTGGGTAWSETVVHSFEGAPHDGGVPYGALYLQPNGALLGTTFSGGSSATCNTGYGSGCGTVFQIVP